MWIFFDRGGLCWLLHLCCCLGDALKIVTCCSHQFATLVTVCTCLRVCVSMCKREWAREKKFCRVWIRKTSGPTAFFRRLSLPRRNSNPSRITFYPIMCLLLQISLTEMSFLWDGVGLVWQPEIASIHKTCLNYSVTWASVDVNGRWSEQLMWPLEKKKRIKLESCLPQPESDLTGTRLSGGKGSSSRALEEDPQPGNL